MAGLEFPQLARDDEFHRNQRTFPRRISQYVGFIIFFLLRVMRYRLYLLNARNTRSLHRRYIHNIDILVFVKYYIIIRAGTSKHMRVRICHVGPACSVGEANFVAARKDVQFFLTELCVCVCTYVCTCYVCTYEGC